MAKNREPEKHVESESESGEEEDDDDATTEEGSDSESERTQIAAKPSPSTPAIVKKIQPVSAPKPPDSSSSDEEESGSETDTDSDENVRPIASKPMPQKSNAVAEKARSKAVLTPVKSTASKRPAEEKETEGKDAKKAKKKPEPENSEKKKPEPEDSEKRTLFQRLWSEDDEIAVLKGMTDYATKKKSDPLVDLSAFHEFIKKNLHVDVTRVQLQDKIRRLKKKYENNKKKEEEGKARNLNPHEQKAYELSKMYWGSENGKESVAEKVAASPKTNGSVARKTAKKKEIVKKDIVADNEEVKDVIPVGGENVLPSKRLNSHSRSAGVEEMILSLGTELFNGGEEEKEWKRLMLEEMEIYQKQLELRSKQTKLVVDALRSRDL